MGMITRVFLCILLALTANQVRGQLSAKEYRIALLLPFKSEGSQNTLTEAMLDYYEGFKMATSYLENEGLRLKLYVFDSEKDSGSMDEILAHSDLKKMDIIVGPVYEKNLVAVEKICAKHRILLVSPLKYYVPQETNSEVINFFAPDSLRLGSIAEKCGRLYPKHRIYVVQDNTKKSQTDAALMRKELKELRLPFVKTATLINGKFTSPLVNSDSIILISAIATKDVKTTLIKAVKNRYQSYVVAYLDWNSSIGSTFEMNEPQMVYPEVNFVSYHDTFASAFRTQFYDQFYGEPSKYAFIGYDQATYLCYGLMTFGRNFSRHLPEAEFRGLINVIRLSLTDKGILNLGLNYLQIIEEERLEFAP